jgi:hypothetical protein
MRNKRPEKPTVQDLPINQNLTAMCTLQVNAEHLAVFMATDVDHLTHLVPRLRKSRAKPLLPSGPPWPDTV